MSATYTLPLLSTATPEGSHSDVAVTPPLLQPCVVKLPSWPRTLSAIVSPGAAAAGDAKTATASTSALSATNEPEMTGKNVRHFICRPHACPCAPAQISR